MKRIFTSTLLFLAAASFAQAHFVFVTADASGTSARIFISEKLVPDLDAGMIAGSKLTLRDAIGREAALTLVKGDGNFFTIALAGSGTRVIHGMTDLGVMTRGGKSHLLIYYPKAMVGDAFGGAASGGENTPVELVPVGKPGSFKLKLLARGKPRPDAEITVIQPDGTEKKVKTDASGETEVFTATGRYGAWARYWEPVGGERDGKKYDELRHYATLVFDAAPAEQLSTSWSGIGSNSVNAFTKLPQATSSFGAVVADGWLYIYGGHVSPTHSYFKEAVSGRFDRVNLSGEPVWESLPAGPAMQGLNLAAYKGKIYRVGGMTPQNERGQPSNTQSLTDAARYDPSTKKWEALPPLPEPRSSHDVVVAGDKLIVVGGWGLDGKTEHWRHTIAILDLSAATPHGKALRSLSSGAL